MGREGERGMDSRGVEGAANVAHKIPRNVQPVKRQEAVERGKMHADV